MDSTVTLIDGYHGLKLQNDLLPLTVGILNDNIIVDPTFDEIELLETSMTIVYDNDMDIVHLYKPGGNQVSIKDLQTIFKLGQKRAQYLIELFKTLQTVDDNKIANENNNNNNDDDIDIDTNGPKSNSDTVNTNNQNNKGNNNKNKSRKQKGKTQKPVKSQK